MPETVKQGKFLVLFASKLSRKILRDAEAVKLNGYAPQCEDVERVNVFWQLVFEAKSDGLEALERFIDREFMFEAVKPTKVVGEHEALVLFIGCEFIPEAVKPNGDPKDVEALDRFTGLEFMTVVVKPKEVAKKRGVR